MTKNRRTTKNRQLANIIQLANISNTVLRYLRLLFCFTNETLLLNKLLVLRLYSGILYFTN